MNAIKRTFVLMVTLAVAAVMAQPPRGYFAWWNSPIARDINLSQDQRKQVREVVRDYRNKLIDVRAAVEKAEGEVEDLFNEDQVDTRRTTEAVERLAAARADLTRTFSQMSLKLRTILTPQQWQELRKRRAEQPRPRGMQQGPKAGQGAAGRPGRMGRRMQRGGPEQPQPEPQPQPPQPPQAQKPPAEKGGSSLN